MVSFLYQKSTTLFNMKRNLDFCSCPYYKTLLMTVFSCYLFDAMIKSQEQKQLYRKRDLFWFKVLKK